MPITKETFEFLAENRFRNSKQWYDEHKDIYRKYVVAPLADMVNEMSETMLSIDPQIVCSPKIGGCISRIRRDTRYTHDKSLYRANAWIVFGRRDRLHKNLPSFYFDMSANGYECGCGYYKADTSTVLAVRELILSKDRDFDKVVKAYEAQNVFKFEGESYKKKRFPDEVGARSEWLEKRNYVFNRSCTDINELFSPDLAKRLSEDFKLLAPMYHFLLKAENSKKNEVIRPAFDF